MLGEFHRRKGAAPKRFYAFAENLPDWELDQPVWLFLSDSQRAELFRLGIVSALPDT
ncbi:MAG: hypothetical protein JW751_20890 [Polyangiaceae bacterium]|nr:hypothetical protein [Polyangiaceae bacterium]